MARSRRKCWPRAPTGSLTDREKLAGSGGRARPPLIWACPYLAGTEISSRSLVLRCTWLRLGFDPENPALLAGLAATRNGRKQRALEMAEGLAKVGIPGYAYEGALNYVADLMSRTHRFARHLVSTGVCHDTQEVFRKYLVQGKPGYVPHRWATLREAVTWITDAGGLAVIAHPAPLQVQRQRGIRAAHGIHLPRWTRRRGGDRQPQCG